MASFDKFLQKYIFRIIGALCVGGLHLLIVAIVVLEGGEGPGFTLLYMDLPIVYLWQFFNGKGGSIFGLTFYFLGTLMYALLGWLIGWMGDWLRQSSQEG